MSGQNPYAPPSLTEPESPSHATWRLDGLGLLVKDHVVLPKVDLETGEQADEMKCVHRQYLGAGVMPLRILLLIAVYLTARYGFHLKSTMAIVIVVFASLVSSRVPLLRSKTGGRVIIWEFAGTATLAGRIKRQRLRAGISVVAAALMMVSPILISGLLDDYTSSILVIFGVGIAIIAMVAVWSIVDRNKARTSAGPPGWLRISPIHPDATSFLALLEAEARESAVVSPEPRKRKMLTAYFHRYPLSVLTRGHRNPLLIFMILLMKLFKSAQLQRDIYHFTEMEPVDRGKLVPKLHTELEDWFVEHPDWELVACEQLAFPTGDVTMQTAVITDREFSTWATIAYSWAVNRPTHGQPHFSFCTRLRNGDLVRTHDQPFLHLDEPGIHEHRVDGIPSEVLLGHLANVGSEPVDPASGPQDLMQRILIEKQRSDEALTHLGYQSEPREVG